MALKIVKKIGHNHTYKTVIGLGKVYSKSMPIVFEPVLYMKPEILNAIYQTNLVSFLLYSISSSKVAAYISLSKLDNDLWVSLPNLPFGGIQSHSEISGSVLQDLLQNMEEWILEHGGRTLTIRMPSSIYPNYLNSSSISWDSLGYRTSTPAVNMHIPVNSLSFQEQIHHSEQRRLRKCLRRGFTSKILSDINLGAWYDWMAQQWQHKQYVPSFSKERFCKMVEAHRDHYVIYEIADKGKRIASGICVKAHSSVLYAFFLADLASYRSFSPMVMIYEQMYEYAQTTNISYLDLGTCLDQNGEYKPSLAQFKARIGGLPTLKRDYYKLLRPISD